jgi:ketosteroid isomerase-like protein
MKKIFFNITGFSALSLALFVSAAAQQAAQSPCQLEQAKQFDFWLGTWDLEWNDAKGNRRTGTNVITKTLGGCVVEENFNGGSGGGGQPAYLGKSHSMFDRRSGKWKQTWVDSGGDYLDFTGEFTGGKMTLWREFTNPAGKLVKQRMTFSEIKADSLDWKWEASTDEGKTWQLNWHIKYKRRVPSEATKNINKSMLRELSDTERADLLKAREQIWRDFFAGNRAGLERSLTPGTITLSPDTEGDRFATREKIFADSEGFVKAGGKLLKLEFPRTEIRVYGDVAVIYTQYMFELEVGGQKSASKGHATEIFVKENGFWTNPGWHMDNY